MSNIEFSYLYRDGSNYKKWAAVVFSNPHQLDTNFINQELRHAFLPDGWFIASQVRVQEVFLYSEGQVSFDDHCYHEFHGVRPTADRTTDAYGRSISEFVAEVKQQSQFGWRAFDPYHRRGSFGSFLMPRLP